MSKEIGTLAVVVLKAKNLHDRHSLYKQDPYAKITLNGKTLETKVDPKGGQHPEWDAELRFTVYSAKSDSARQMEVSCWRKEPRGDEEIGKGKVDISDTLKTGEFDDWVPINDTTGTYRGEIYLEMTFFSSGPPPLERRPSKLPPQERLHHLKQGAVPAAGGNLTVPGGPNVHGPPPAKNNKPFPPFNEPQAPTQPPPLLRPGSNQGAINGHGRRPSGHTSPVNVLPPSSLTAGRPPSNRHDSDAFRMPGHSHTLPSNGNNLSYSPPRESQLPPSLSHSPPRQSRPEYNPYVSNPPPPSNQAPGYFPSPQILVGHSPPETASFGRHRSGSGYSPPQHSPPQIPPSAPASTGPPNFPTSPRPPSPTFRPPQSTLPYPLSQSTPPYQPSHSAPPPPPSQPIQSYSPPQSTPSYPPPQSTPPYPPPQSTSPYPPPQPIYPPSQPGYPQSQSTYPSPSQPAYSAQAPQFPSHYPTFSAQPHGGYSPYEYGTPPPGPAQRPFFLRDDSAGGLPDPALAQRYSSPLPLPNDTGPHRSNSPFPVPSIPPVAPPQHPVASPFSPHGNYDGDFQRRREQEERDAEYARRLDMELNLAAP